MSVALAAAAEGRNRGAARVSRRGRREPDRLWSAPMSGQETKSKYKDTVILPDTPFPMRGDLAKREPEILASWEDSKLYERIGAARANAPLDRFACRRWQPP